MSSGISTVLLSTTASTVAAAPFVRQWLKKRQLLDVPNERSSHSFPIPRGGGLACAIGAGAGTAVSMAVRNPPSAAWAGSCGVLGIVGRCDDLVGLPASLRLGTQVACGLVVGGRAGDWKAAALSGLAVPAVVNAFNFMDGINGISGGTAAAWGLCIATDSALPSAVRYQGAITAGMGLGFLPFNVPNAAMFLGDVGSYLIGASVAATVVEGSVNARKLCLSAAVRLVTPLVPYLTDTGGTMLRRARQSQSLTQAHREHVYQRLVHELGWRHWEVSALVASAAIACGVAGRSRWGALVVGGVSAVYWMAPTGLKAVKLARAE